MASSKLRGKVEVGVGTRDDGQHGQPRMENRDDSPVAKTRATKKKMQGANASPCGWGRVSLYGADGLSRADALMG